MEKTKREAEQELNRKLAEWAECFREDQLPDFTQSLDDCFKWLVPKVYSTIQVEDICFGKENGEDYCISCGGQVNPKRIVMVVEFMRAEAITQFLLFV